MITVHVWRFRGLKVAMGHASMTVGQDYISWWPEGSARRPKLPAPVGGMLPLYSVRHIHGQSFADDQLYEALNEHSEWDLVFNRYVDRRTGNAVVPLRPDVNISLQGLDESRLLAWWKKYNVPDRDWSTLGANCATTVGRGLMMAGGDDYALGSSGWWHSWNAVWNPDDVLRYARKIEQGLKVKQGHHAAINLIRRFCTSPLGFTSITANMDEKGLAHAIYDHMGGDTAGILSVFQELNERRNTDADDVAEIYVNLLRTRKGAPLAAVARDLALRQLLIKILGEGWTTDSEKACITFLKSLA